MKKMREEERKKAKTKAPTPPTPKVDPYGFEDTRAAYQDRVIAEQKAKSNVKGEGNFGNPEPEFKPKEGAKLAKDWASIAGKIGKQIDKNSKTKNMETI
ncbi:MAG: hypothetical protein H8E36_02560 [Rhodospirillaceae bacterium]|nr:hypothetical protein [Rhodospirillaceae bacterium]